VEKGNRQIILIVDDTPENLRILGNLLEREYDVRIAANGPDALDTVTSSAPDLILLDIVMPGMDGFEVCRQLKAHPDFRMIPVIFISALGMSEHKIQAFREGAVDYITKPFQSEEVVARVHTHLELSKMTDLKREIAERKRAEEALRASESINRTILESMSQKLFLKDRHSVYLSVNKSFASIFGLKPEHFPGKDDFAFFPAGLAAKYQADDQAVMSSGQEKDFEETFMAEGKNYQVRTIKVPVRNEAGEVTALLGIFEDITGRKEMEARFQQAQKMETIGTLAGGIAHDFNNLLFPIIGLSELLLEDLPAGGINRQNAAGILKAARRAAELVKQILSFSRQAEHKKIPVRIQKILQEVIKLTRATIPSSIELTLELQSDCGLVLADPTQLHQIAMNLITNAYHAVEATGGSIAVRLTETELCDKNMTGNPLKAGKYAALSITDNGCGIAPEVMGKIFEPYFTTKELGKGTGLGLSVVYGIAKEHGGDIRVRSKVGRGTTVNVYLPLLKNAMNDEEPDMPVIHETGTEKILLVDDEEPIARLEQIMLEKLGYRVTTRTDSLAALAAFKANPDGFDLVITDMTMPNMTGDRLARELGAIKPGIPVIICTGFSTQIDEKSAQAMGANGFLMKPVAKSQIARMVRKVLDEVKG
jgi:PAS domain S-box-containing protein